MARAHVMSVQLRSELRSTAGREVLSSIQDHMYDKALDYFDPRADWQTANVLELSELAHKVRDFAQNLELTNPVKIEAIGLATMIWNDFTSVYEVAKKRANPNKVA